MQERIMCNQIVLSVIGISWKDSITNVEVRTRTGQQTVNNITERKTTSLADITSAYHSKFSLEGNLLTKRHGSFSVSRFDSL